MKHPKDYSPVHFNGFHVVVVDAGTTIKDERSGDEVTVDDTTACRKGTVIYCTDPVFQSLKDPQRRSA
jgi:hypothetical protein